jgi:hypothetical protein
VPNREIKESCRTSPTLDRLSDFSERLFWRLTTVADDFGRFPSDARFLRSECFPLKETLKSAKVARAFSELIQVGLVIEYREGDRTYGQFTTWEKHQRRRAEHSKYPPPSSANICRHPPSDSADLRSTIFDQDPKDRSTIYRSRPASGRDEEFELFYQAYPKKRKPGDAEKAWTQTQGQRPPIKELLAALERMKRCHDWTKEGGKFIPYPASWLRTKGWLESPEVEVAEVKPWKPPEDRAAEGDTSGLADFFVKGPPPLKALS